MAHKCCHGNPLDRYTGIARGAFLRLFAMRREAGGQRVCGSQPIAERRWLETTSSDSSGLSCGGRRRDPSRAASGRGWRVRREALTLPLRSFNMCPHRQERAALRRDEHVNIAGEFHLVVVKVVVHLLPGDQVPQRGDVAHAYVTETHRGRRELVTRSAGSCQRYVQAAMSIKCSVDQPAVSRSLTCRVQLSLLQLGLIQEEQSVPGQLQGSTDQPVGHIVLLGNQPHLVHVLEAHGQIIGLRRI